MDRRVALVPFARLGGPGARAPSAGGARVNYFELYPGDYLRDTARLTLVEHGAYFRLMLAYYGEGKPFADDANELYAAAGAASAADKAAVRKVADKYFPVGPDGLRHNNRCDQVIAQARARMDESPADKKTAQALRAKRYRDRRASMFEVLRQNGIVFDFNAPTDMLEAAVMDLASRQTRDASRDANGVDGDAGDVGGHDAPRDGGRDVTASRPQTPDPITTPEATQPPDASQGAGAFAACVTGTPGAAAAALRKRGCAINSTDPRLLDAVAGGVTTEQLVDLHETYPDKPAAYLIQVAVRQLTERAAGASATTTAPGHATTLRPGPQSLADRSASDIAAYRRRRDGEGASAADGAHGDGGAYDAIEGEWEAV